ncbi:bifunctional phosphoribosyl-AMP cyclohydrolase/phosphoribosyl-ATP diphosphatase HisIE [Acidithiobacillus thiooxidans]|jgi:phosphoribosyl-ATP pyrophosphohydrolase/phosphoribosyl-AMP cyclohydrolase|uniref:Histidine biosynthesis bifunctional protein HisIE n=2 Tax=Acidithiobacillus thiooxidans TaxID=930 RepID=A0A1C2IMZ5_ACITH|nr:MULTISPECIES: bifunctional phosphoribosyl-AMP cyclohydrolase/phosphoribosyl-ATP diphosphatase HisIE [Acidithiobacillus]MBE7565319.1 bifunctional phosphoribosyl-AMP cyclohydrolase/phosphoribosyl-ATP diphosphatase HisIE [Acidithiobacillus sp. HP-11]MBU2740625.1 bifunctional phosphoribosyl-AMP cyclohydrolase/phosphoribosyl-ATP diphosphatase HisIE [Acidithiobacillus albertensis]MBU2752884.1 bifunctional phosphoribosyl-AMP cyclohydrolase/phosphoribosyl-ATP diphosphatase HisIE [Acidithiobacillus th
MGDNQYNALLAAVRWNADGLVPAIAQDARSGRVLMLAWMNAEALTATLRDEMGTYWSRSRQALWRKGESSGHFQHLVDLRLDCDGDTLLMRVIQEGPACHTGEATCFFQGAPGAEGWQHQAPPPGSILDSLQSTLHQRRQADPGQSYVAQLLHGGQDRILKKVGEEATEFVLACKNHEKKPIIAEAADLLFHLMVALEEQDLHVDDVLAELAKREGISGLDEKAARRPLA